MPNAFFSFANPLVNKCIKTHPHLWHRRQGSRPYCKSWRDRRPLLAKDIKVTHSSHPSLPGTCTARLLPGVQHRLGAGDAGRGPGSQAQVHPRIPLIPARPSPQPRTEVVVDQEAQLLRDRGWARPSGLVAGSRPRDCQSAPTRPGTTPALPTFPPASQPPRPRSPRPTNLIAEVTSGGTWRLPQPVKLEREKALANGRRQGAGLPRPS